jgi:hypothetical protein
VMFTAKIQGRHLSKPPGNCNRFVACHVKNNQSWSGLPGSVRVFTINWLPLGFCGIDPGVRLGWGVRSRILLPSRRATQGNRLPCEGFTLSLLPDVAKAVKTASVVHPNQDDESCDALRRTASGSLPTFGHGGNSAVGVPFFRLP